MRPSLLLLATLSILALSFAPLADAATTVRCVTLKDGSKVCVTVAGTCASADYIPTISDSGAGAGACTAVSAGPAGVTACQEAIAGYVTIAGWQGVWVEACAYEYPAPHGSCVDTTVESNQFYIRDLPPFCTVLA